MKICITSSGNNLESQLDQRFGRCTYFIIWDDATDTFEAIANPYIDVGSGAGIQSAQLVVEKKPAKVITGAVGPKAEAVLKTAKVEMITGESENTTVKEIIEKYKNEDKKKPSNLQQAVTGEVKVGWIRKYARRYLGFGMRKNSHGFGGGSRGGGGIKMGRGFEQAFGRGRGGFCICPKCGEKQTHQRGIPCQLINCSKCGSRMIRE